MFVQWGEGIKHLSYRLVIKKMNLTIYYHILCNWYVLVSKFYNRKILLLPLEYNSFKQLFKT